MNRTDFIAHLHDLDACDEVLEWIDQTPGEPEDLWTACQRGDWMIWLLDVVAYDERTLRHIACDCAESALPIYERAHPTDCRPRDCIAVARRYADGEATYDELVVASDAAMDAAWAAADDSAYAAARAATWATAKAATDTAADYAAKAVARAAAYAAAGDAAWSASWAASSDAAWAAARARQADMVRARVSWADLERVMEHAAREERRDA